MAEVTIREAGRGDIPAVLEVWAQARSGAAVTPDTVESLELLLDRSPGGLLVAEVDGRVLVAHDEQEAAGLWRATGYELDEHIGRFVRNL